MLSTIYKIALIALVLIGISINLFAQDDRFLPSRKDVKAYNNYYLKFNNENKIADWVAYEFTYSEFLGTVKRSNNFRPDKSILEGTSQLSDFKGSGYDRGHLIPSANMRFSEIAMSECFFLSNIVPQHLNMNRGRWKQLENKVREWVKVKRNLYIITGTVIDEKSKRIGENRVAVPLYLYKIIYDDMQKEAIAFLMPNRRITSNEHLETFIVTIDMIEEITGIDFFGQLENNLEERIESKIVIEYWF